MTAACGNPLCFKEGTKLCSRCKCAFYCSDECCRQTWNEHKTSCDMTLADLPLPPERNLAATPPNFPFQATYVVDALERVVRVVKGVAEVNAEVTPVDGEPPGKAVSRPALLGSKTIKIVQILTKHDSLSEAQRFLHVSLDDSDTDPSAGDDIYTVLHATGVAASLLPRMASQRKSLPFCLAALIVLEMLAKYRTAVVMHGREKIGTFFLARGHVRSLQPRLVVSKKNHSHDDSESATEMNAVYSQPASVENEHYVLLLVPECVFSESRVPDLARIERGDREAMALDAKMKREREAFRKANFGERLDGAFVSNAQREDGRVAALRDRAVFVGPAVGECDARLHRHRVFKGVPEWFFVAKLFDHDEMESLQFGEKLSTKALDLADSILVQMFGKSETDRLVALREAARTSTCAKS